MSLPIFAFFSRSLRVESRAISTYGKRLALVVVILLVLVICHVQAIRLSAAGLRFFAPVVYINLVFLTLVGLGYSSSAITEEREEETLGLLKMSRLNSVAILLGKSTSRLIGVTMLVLAQFPFTLLAVTLGGVSLAQVFAAYATLLAYIFFLGNFALFCSVCCKRTANAAGLTGLVVIFGFLLAGPIGSGLVPYLAYAGWFAKDGAVCRVLLWLVGAWMAANPFVRTIEIMATGFNAHPIGIQVISNLALGVFFFLLAWATFGFFTREQQTPAQARGLLAKGRISPRRWLGLPRAWRPAIAWKEFHFLTGGRLMVLIRCVLLAGIIAVIAHLQSRSVPRRYFREAVATAFMLIPLVMAGLEGVVHAGRIFQQEVRWGTLPRIAMIPMSMPQLAYAKLLGFLPALIPYLVCFLVGVLLAPELFAEGIEEAFVTEGSGWCSVAHFVAFVHFVAFLSLVIKRAALLVALGSWLIGYYVLVAVVMLLAGPFVRPKTYETMNVALAVGLVALTILLHVKTLSRLKRLAGQ